jgi:hypothetical protein
MSVYIQKTNKKVLLWQPSKWMRLQQLRGWPAPSMPRPNDTHGAARARGAGAVGCGAGQCQGWCEPRHGGLPRPFGAYIGVVGEDRPSPRRGAFAQLAACIRQDKTRPASAKTNTQAGGLSALLHHRLAFIGAPGHRLGGGDALDRTRRRAEERSGVHAEAALQLLASPYGLRGSL